MLDFVRIGPPKSGLFEPPPPRKRSETKNLIIFYYRSDGDQAGDPELNPGSLETITVEGSDALLVSRAPSSECKWISANGQRRFAHLPSSCEIW